MHVGAERSRGPHGIADLNRLHRLQRHHRRRQLRVQALVPIGVRAEPGWHVVGHDLEDATDGVAGAQHEVHLLLHARFGISIGAVEQDVLFLRERLDRFPCDRRIKPRTADSNDVAQDFDSQFTQQQLGNRSRGDAGRRFARRRSLQDVSRLAEVVLQRARQISMTGTGRRNPLMLGGISFFNRQGLRPVLPVLVGQQDGNRRADGLAMAYTAQDVRRVALNAHPSSAPVALLAAPKLAIHKFEVDREPSRACPRAPPRAPLRGIRRQWKNAA